MKVVIIVALALYPVLVGSGCGRDAEPDEISHVNEDLHDHGDADDHGDTHDHESHSEHAHGEADEHQHGDSEDDYAEGGFEAVDPHAGHDHAEHGHDEGGLFLSAEAIRLAGIRVKTAQSKSLTRTIELPGEIGFNEDRLVHVTPRYAGVAREVHGRIGADVSEGEVLAVIESNESLSRYSITAPISGRIIEKHLAVGEFVAEDRDLFLIADLSTVWANCEVYAKDMPYVRQGASVLITAVEAHHAVEATLAYVAPVYSEDTRSALARAVLKNNGDSWRPGTFIRATVPVRLGDQGLAVEKDAIQILDEEQVVFVPGETDGEFETVPVRTGVSDDSSVEILSGLSPGDLYVAEGAFELKAKMVTANLDAHAGHGH
jgi:cobalt-zinc-cadmium efflux system membrane fusion protein